MTLRRTLRRLRLGSSHEGALVAVIVWWALLVAAVIGAWNLVAAHRAQVETVPTDFPPPVREANVPTLGANVHLERYDDQELSSALSLLADGGFVWVRQPFPRSAVLADGLPGAYEWSSTDRLMAALRRQPTLRLVPVLIDDPPLPPRDPDSFAAYAGAFAARYGDQVDVYQIWDEPNLAANWGGGPVSPTAYADLLARTADAIRAADPGSRIMLAGLAPTVEAGPHNLSEVHYLEQLYEAGAESAFDIVAAKPYGFDTGPEDRRVDASLLNVSRVLLLREVMVAHGDAETAVWASHWGWNALPQNWDGSPSLWGQTDEATQSAHSVALLDRARQEWPWMGAMIIENLQPRSSSSRSAGDDVQNRRWGFSLLAPDGTPRPVYEAIRTWARSQVNAAPVGGYPADNQWATYDEGWRAGPVGADVRASGESGVGGKAAFCFDGTRIALTVRRGPYRGFLYVTVDGEPANALPQDERGRAYVVLYDERVSVATVPLAVRLEPGAHRVEVIAEGGEGQWPLVDWRVGATPMPCILGWRLAGLVGAACLLMAFLLRGLRRVSWGFVAQRVLEFPEKGQVALMGVGAGVVWAAAALSWSDLARGAPLSDVCGILTLSALPLLTYLLALRLDLGLALVAFAAPFYLVPRTMFYRALSMPEVLVALCSIGLLARLFVRRHRGRDGQCRSALDDPSFRYGKQFSGIDWSVTLLVLSALVAAAASEDHLAALFELRTVFLFPTLCYLLARITPLDRPARRRIVGALVVGGVGVALIGLVQAASGRNLAAAEGGLLRIQSVYHSPNSVGLYLGRVWPFLVVGLVLGRDRRARVWAGIGLFVVTLALGLSFSRGALLLALPVSLLVMGWWAGGRYRWAAIAALGAGAVSLIPLLGLPRFAALLDLGQGTTFFRLKLWESSIKMVREHPLFGVGPGNFLKAYRTRYVLPMAWEEFNLGHAHNLLLDHWTRLGLLGVVAGAVLQATFWRALARRGRVGSVVGLAGSMAALLAHGMVDNVLFAPDLAIAFFLVLALAHDVNTEEQATENGQWRTNELDVRR